MKDGKLIYIDGKVLVNDFKKDSKNPVELKEYEYQDNIKELLKQENIIEKLENEKTYINNRILNNYTTINKFTYANRILTVMWIFLPLFFSFLGCLMSFDIQQLLSLSIFSTIITTIGIIGPFNIFKNILKAATKSNNGYKLELEELEKELVKNKEILNKLQNNNSKENEQEAMNKKTEDIHNIHLEEYNKIRNELLFYREIGENNNKLLKFFNNGTLEENLNQIYDLNEIEKIKIYFKSKK